jgi:acetyl-CoA carboxylase beta subunit
MPKKPDDPNAPKPRTKKVWIICAWCRKKMYQKEVPADFKGISHGICPQCYKKQLEELGEE